MAKQNESSLNWCVRDSLPSRSGDDVIPDYGFVKEGDKIVFKKTGEHSRSEYINSFISTTDIKEIFKRYQAGDMSVLQKAVGQYIDVVGAPDNLLDAQLMLKNGEQLWSQLPTDLKDKYGSMEAFVQAAVDGKLADDFNISKNEINKAKDEEIASLKKQIEDLQGGVKYE